MKQKIPIKKFPNKTFILNLEINRDEIQKEYQNTLKSIQSNFETKGFRKGKAPLNMVENQTSDDKVFEEVASHLISHYYADSIKSNNLKPIIQPQIKFLNEHPDFNHDWQIEITSTELPEIKLNNKYFEEVKQINSNKTIDDDKKTSKIIEIIVKNSTIDLPEILIQSDLQSHLSNLINQANQAGITVQQYLDSQKQTLDNYKTNLRKRIIEEWTINLAISQIAQDNKIEVSENEVKEILTKNPKLSQNINMVYYLLTQQKVFEFLKK